MPPQTRAEQKRFFALMKAAGLHMDGVTDVGWDTVRLVTAALNKLPPDADAAQLHDYLVKVQDFYGIDGHYDFVHVPQRGLDVSDAIVVRWDAATKDWDPVSKLTGIPLGQ